MLNMHYKRYLYIRVYCYQATLKQQTHPHLLVCCLVALLRRCTVVKFILIHVQWSVANTLHV